MRMKLPEKLKPLFNAIDTFTKEVDLKTTSGPHVRDSLDLKRLMLLVVFALVPCTIMAIWNSGLTAYVFGSSNLQLMQEYILASQTFQGYFSFAFSDHRYIPIIKEGLIAFIPVLMISYAVGGLWEVLFAVLRGHEVSEGFLVTGILFALILPPTIPYWMVAVGVSVGIVIGKELFGGTGMNLLNPALTCRCFLYFTFPNKMTGDIWVGTNPIQMRDSLTSINLQANAVDGYTQATVLNQISANDEVKRIHVDALGAAMEKKTSLASILEKYFAKFSSFMGWGEPIEALSQENLRLFVTSSTKNGGLGLSPEYYLDAKQLADVKFSQGINTDGNFFFGNMLGSFGETSTIACLLGALLLLVTGIAAWRTMVAFGLGAWLTAYLFELGAKFFGPESGAWNIARFDLPAYKHLIIGGLAFGLVFMATDPVSSPTMKFSKWIYGAMIGAITIIIRLINPAFPEGVMLAILFGNVFAPLLDHFALNSYRRYRRVRKQAAV